MSKILKKDHIILRICKHGYENQYFTINELIEEKVISKGVEHDFTLTLLEATKGPTTNPNALAKLSDKDNFPTINDWKFTLLPSALFSYVDHLELQDARKNAKTAKTQSFWAIVISIVSLLASIAIGLFQIIIEFILSIIGSASI